MEKSLRDLVYKWFQGRNFTLSAGFFAGRGPNEGDLNSKILERMYVGLMEDVGQVEATNFVRFVNKLEDLSASAFIVAFERFWGNDCQVVVIPQHSEDGNTLDAYGDGLMAQGLALIGNSLFRSRSNDAMLHAHIKAAFIMAHWGEIPEDERPQEKPRFESYYAF
jgi:hypothetical protein